jgi:hypothetical protein
MMPEKPTFIPNFTFVDPDSYPNPDPQGYKHFLDQKVNYCIFHAKTIAKPFFF